MSKLLVNIWLVKMVKTLNQKGFFTKLIQFTLLLQKNEHLTATETFITDYIYNIKIFLGNKILAKNCSSYYIKTILCRD